MVIAWFQLELTRPGWLAMLLVVPPLFFYFLRSLVDLPRRQMVVSLLVRTIIVLLLVLCLAGLNRMDPSGEPFVVFAIDESLSVDEQSSEDAREFIRRATQDRDQSTFAVLPFASTPGMFRSAAAAPVAADSASAGTEQGGSDWHRGTDLGAVVESAAAGIPPDFVPRLVVLTDGNPTSGDFLRAAVRSGLKISTVPMRTREDPEIQVSAVHVPAQVAQGEPFRVEVIVDANHDDTALVEIYNGEHRIAAAQEEIRKGENRFVFTEQVDGPSEFTARISRAPSNAEGDAAGSFDDTLLDNNMASALVYASGKPRVLLIDSDPETARNLEWALDEEGIIVDTRPARGMPDSLRELQKYEVLILSNVPATELSSRQMDIVRSWVSDLGGGLIMLGGDQSFGLGGYYRTAIEEVLPVRSDFEKEKEKPGLAMVLVIDKSGSMGGQKIELAKDAARASVELLGPKDQIGVIAFEGSPFWVSDLRSAAQKSNTISAIASIESGGGTALYPAMSEAFEALRRASAKLKHVIILTDGHSTPGDFDGITREMAAHAITVSTVGIGNADQELLERIAEAGNGRYYFTNDAGSIPQIFAKETMTAGKSAINEEPFIPVTVRSTQVLADVSMDDAPFLLGYVITRPKPTSEVILATESGDPLLSWWRYGLGMSVAFTSDARGRWAVEWLTWPGYNKFWAQVVRHCMRRSEAQGFVVDVRRDGEMAFLQIDAVDDTGRYLNQADTELTLIGPQLQATRLSVEQSAPGRYETEFPLREPGTWHLQITQQKDGRLIHQQSRGLVVGYNDELRLRDANEALLKQIAVVTGGEFDPEPNAVFTVSQSESVSSTRPLWPFLLMLALVMFAIDVALRRLEMPALFGRMAHRSGLRT